MAARRRGTIRVGTCGFGYDAWRDTFYVGVPRERWLEHYARSFDLVEIDATFYRLQARHTLEGWATRTPAGFTFTIKGHRYVTHRLRLRGVADAVARCRRNAAPLGEKLDAVLWQLPADLAFERERLDGLMAALDDWPRARHALEPRHRSWFRDDVADVLRRHRVAVCLSDAPRWPLWDAVTTDLVYVRLHGHTRLYASRYASRSLARWAARARAWADDGRDVHLCLDNTAEGAAVHDALALSRLVHEVQG